MEERGTGCDDPFSEEKPTPWAQALTGKATTGMPFGALKLARPYIKDSRFTDGQYVKAMVRAAKDMAQGMAYRIKEIGPVDCLEAAKG